MIIWTILSGLWLLVVALGDLHSRRIPNYLVLIGTALVMVGAILGNQVRSALLGGGILFGAYLLTRLFCTGIGGGDIKVSFPMGALAGMYGEDAWIVAALGALCTTALVGLVVQGVNRYKNAEDSDTEPTPMALPHGTFMSLWTGGILVVALLFT